MSPGMSSRGSWRQHLERPDGSRHRCQGRENKRPPPGIRKGLNFRGSHLDAVSILRISERTPYNSRRSQYVSQHQPSRLTPYLYSFQVPSRLKMMLPLIAVIMLYPLGKRPTARKFHVYPQYFLGTALGYPTIYGWCAIYGNELTLSEILARCYPLWVFLFCWSFFANTAYSYQDAVDDRRMGLNSAYNLAGDHMRAFLAVLGGITLLTIPMVLRPHTSVWLWVSWLGMWTTGIVRQLLEYDQRKPETGGTLHRQTVWFGFCSIAICIVELVWIQLSTAVG